MTETQEQSALVKIVQDAGLPETNSKLLVEHFKEFEDKAKEWKEIAEKLVVTDVSQKAEMQQADEARKALVKVRTGIAKKHKELKDSALKEGRLYDLIKNTLTSFIEPIEEHLELQANFEKIQIENERKRIQSERALALSTYMDNAESMPLSDMNEDAFNNLLSGQKLAYDARIEAEKKAEQDRIEAEEREKQEKENLRLENERLNREAEEVAVKKEELKKELEQKALVYLIENGFEATNGGVKSIHHSHFIGSGHFNQFESELELERFKKHIEESNKLNEQRAKDEAEKKALEEKNKDAQAEADRLAAELKEKKDKEEADEKARLAAEKKAQRAPDKQKLLSIVDKIEVLQIEVSAIDFKDADAKAYSEAVVTLLEKIRVFVQNSSNKL